MKLNNILKTAIFAASIVGSCYANERQQPNIVIIYTDDQGYADLGCYGGKHVYTPRIDQMAAEGAKLTSFYMAAPLCTPSRAALMTGSYPARINMHLGTQPRKHNKGISGVLKPGDAKGLNPDEITIAEVLSNAGYTTGMFGKWHLGDQPEFLPTRQGFDEFYGLPYSHDINSRKRNFPPLPLLEGEKVIGLEPAADQLTRAFTKKAIDFIERHQQSPFFLYIPHPMPHGPVAVSKEYMEIAPEHLKNRPSSKQLKDVNRKDLYPLAIAEIDWSVGQILDTLKACGLDDNTLVIFTTDNGPWCTSADPLRGKKNDALEGGMRVPAVFRWPGKIPAGTVSDELMTAMDLLPTFAGLAGAKLADDRVIDGKDIWPVLTEGAKTPHEFFFYHERDVLKAVRSGDWKLFINEAGEPVQLYNLRSDVGERKNLLAENPEKAEALLNYLKAFAKDMKENSRVAGFVENPKPLKL